MIDEAFLTDLYTELRPKLVVWLKTRRIDEAMAEDMVQEAFIRIWQRREVIRPNPQEVAGLVWKVVKNINVDTFRHHRNEVLTDDMEQVSDQNAFAENAAIPKQDAQFISSKLKSALDTMSAELAEAWRMFQDEGMTIREISCRTGASESLVKVRIFRARQKMQEALHGSGYGA